MTPWHSADLQANGIRLHYTRTGGGRPPLVLAHGVSDDGLCWTSTAQGLAPDYDVVMVDARGHGQSDAPAHGYGPADHAADLAGLIAGLGLHAPVIMGHSMGAMTTLTLAARYPDVPGAIVLEDPPPWWMGPARNRDEWRAEMRAWLEGLKRHTREETIANQHAEAPNWPLVDLGPWADAKLRFNFNALQLGVDTNVEGAAQLQRISCPALLVTADPELGALVTPAAAAGLKALVPQLSVAHVPGAGHNIRRDQAAPYLEVVRGFLAQR